MQGLDASQPNNSSFLSGNAWVLQVYIRHQDPNEPTACTFQEVSIPATYDTRATWNTEFWRLFPGSEPAFRQRVAGDDGIVVITSFPYSPTVSFKERYGLFRLSKIRRIAKYWRQSKQLPPPDVTEAINAYEQDHTAYNEQYQAAWQELTQRRLPTPPRPYYWYHYEGGLIGLDKDCFFRLWHPDLGFAPQAE